MFHIFFLFSSKAEVLIFLFTGFRVGIVQTEPITIGTTVTLIFHCFLILRNGLSICLFFLFFFVSLFISIIIIFLAYFSHQLLLTVFYWSLSDSKALQVFRTFLSILADLNSAVVLIVSSCHMVYNSSCTFTKPLRIVPSKLNTLDIIVTFMFQSFIIIFFTFWKFFTSALADSLSLEFE